MAIVESVLARVFVDDLAAALPLYVGLAGGAAPQRFAFRDVELARVGPFLLLQVPADRRAAYARVATLLVTDVAAAATLVTAAGGALLEGPAEGPNGPRLIARHADGAVFEYVQPRD